MTKFCIETASEIFPERSSLAGLRKCFRSDNHTARDEIRMLTDAPVMMVEVFAWKYITEPASASRQTVLRPRIIAFV